MAKWSKYDVADYLDSEESCRQYLEAAIALDDPLLIQSAIGDIARARGMSTIAESTGLSRENLYRSLSGKKEALFSTVLKVIKALGYRIELVPLK